MMLTAAATCRTCPHVRAGHVLSNRCLVAPFQSESRAVGKRHCSVRRGRQSGVIVQASGLDPQSTLAVTQQAIAFVAVTLGEGWFTRGQLRQTAKGRPSIPVLVAACGAIVAAAVLFNTGEDKAVLGAGLGLGVSVLLFFAQAKRLFDVEQDMSWPGPKAWPATMCLLTFFSINIFLQALSKVLTETA